MWSQLANNRVAQGAINLLMSGLVDPLVDPLVEPLVDPLVDLLVKLGRPFQ